MAFGILTDHRLRHMSPSMHADAATTQPYDEEIEVMQQMMYFQQNQDSNLAPTGTGLPLRNSTQDMRLFPGH
jgi:hypothetical protein